MMNTIEERPPARPRRKAPIKTEQIVTVVTPSVRRRVDAYAEQTEQTMSEIMRRALAEFLDRNDVVDPGPTPAESNEEAGE